MKVTALLFAGLRDAVGEGRLELELTEGDDVAALWAVIEGVHPDVGAYRDQVAFALGDKLLKADATLSDGAEVAILPPISGG